MNLFHVILLAIIQGVTELFPVSSLGHAILFSSLVGWGTDLKSPTLLPFLVALHLGTAVALGIYFWKDWLGFLKPSAVHPVFKQTNQRVLTYLVVGTVPTALVAFVLQKKLEQLFSKPMWVAVFLIANGFLLFVGEFLKRRSKIKTLEKLTLKESAMIGACQVLALLPGFSRSGSTLVGGLVMGFTHEAAAYFSFLLATPLIFIAGAYELPKLFKLNLHTILIPTIIGGIVAGIFAYLSTYFLLRYMKARETSALLPFGVYCIILGVVSLLVH